jgi:predicted phosphodiesterase
MCTSDKKSALAFAFKSARCYFLRMRYTIFSDIHNHTEALRKIVADANTHNTDTFFCLGDIGIDDCVEIVRDLDAPTVFGNWEVSNWRHLSAANQQWVLTLPPMLHPDNMCLTHAAPFWPPTIKSLADLKANPPGKLNGKLFPYLDFEEDYLWKAIGNLTEAQLPVMFHGHTHRQLVWRFTRTNKLLREHKPVFQLNQGETYVIGVGSVGRPHDGPGASYLIFDDQTNTVEFHRV